MRVGGTLVVETETETETGVERGSSQIPILHECEFDALVRVPKTWYNTGTLPDTLIDLLFAMNSLDVHLVV